MYTNNILHSQESTTILNAHTKKVWKLIVCPSFICPTTKQRYIWFSFRRLFNAKAIHLEKQLWFYSTQTLGDEGVCTFTEIICPKVNTITRLVFELTYYGFTVQHISHYTTRIPR